MKITIINCFDTYGERIENIKEYFIENNFEVTIIQSDFKHFKKEFVKQTEVEEGTKLIKTLPYFKNLSFKRIMSHYFFAKDAFKKVKEDNPDIIYVIVPPNFLTMFAKRYKNKNPKTKIIFDLIDLWPETMPIGSYKKKFPFSMWSKIRNDSFTTADHVITECDLYQDELIDQLKNSNVTTVYLTKETIKQNYKELSDKESLNLCYLGSINNIIDIDKIEEIVKEFCLHKQVNVHIIGDGENRNLFVEKLEKTAATVYFHGKIYDTAFKSEIFNNCHYGINIMKNTVCVGLTMKSLDYFQNSLPIINNIPGDTSKLVDHHKIGFNIDQFDISQLALNVCKVDSKEHLNFKKNTEQIFNTYFSKQAFTNKMNKAFEDIKERI